MQKNDLLQLIAHGENAGYVDMRGMGARRKIVPLTRAWRGQEARFELTRDFLRVTIPARQAPLNPS